MQQPALWRSNLRELTELRAWLHFASSSVSATFSNCAIPRAGTRFSVATQIDSTLPSTSRWSTSASVLQPASGISTTCPVSLAKSTDQLGPSTVRIHRSLPAKPSTGIAVCLQQGPSYGSAPCDQWRVARRHAATHNVRLTPGPFRRLHARSTDAYTFQRPGVPARSTWPILCPCRQPSTISRDSNSAGSLPTVDTAHHLSTTRLDHAGELP